MIRVVAMLTPINTCNGKRLMGRADRDIKRGEQLVLRRAGEQFELLTDHGLTNKFDRESLYSFVLPEDMGEGERHPTDAGRSAGRTQQRLDDSEVEDVKKRARRSGRGPNRLATK